MGGSGWAVKVWWGFGWGVEDLGGSGWVVRVWWGSGWAVEDLGGSGWAVKSEGLRGAQGGL